MLEIIAILCQSNGLAPPQDEESKRIERECRHRALEDERKIYYYKRH